MLKKIHLLISGKVQGVFYRVKAKGKAEELKLTGWIKNNPDGKVEILAEGKESNLKELIKWCYDGSRNAVVEDIKVDWREGEGKFDQFEILL